MAIEKQIDLEEVISGVPMPDGITRSRSRVNR